MIRKVCKCDICGAETDESHLNKVTIHPYGMQVTGRNFDNSLQGLRTDNAIEFDICDHCVTALRGRLPQYRPAFQHVAVKDFQE